MQAVAAVGGGIGESAGVARFGNGKSRVSGAAFQGVQAGVERLGGG